MAYGFGYIGSKNHIAEQIIEQLPTADYFVDLFAGGCSVTHCAILSGKFTNYIVNDWNTHPMNLLRDTIKGDNLTKENEWVSRERFNDEKASDPLIRYCWSYGNNGKDYIYSKQLEPIKENAHSMYMETGRKTIRLQHLENLNRLKRVHADFSKVEPRLEIHSTDFERVEIPNNGVIYCDIPYKGRKAYDTAPFDYERFYEWARRQKNIYISEYEMPEGFTCVAEWQRRCTLAHQRKVPTVERLFVPTA